MYKKSVTYVIVKSGVTLYMALDKKELERLMSAGETEQVERCESSKNKDKISKTICAFANDMSHSQKTGVLFIGLTDKGECANIDITDRKLLEMASIRSDGNIQPLPICSIRKETVKGCNLIVIEVQPSKMTPLRYKGQCWIRVGPSVVLASPQEELQLAEKRQSMNLPYDMQSLPGVSTHDLDMEYFKIYYLPSSIAPDVLEENDRPLEQQMQSLRLLDRTKHPTVAALLTLGKTPRNWIPGSFIQFVRFEGTRLTDTVKNQREVSGKLPDQIKGIEEILDAHISKSLKLSNSTHIETADYPIAALRQIVRNAIMHRNYNSSNPIRVYWFSDRVEITSPGGLYGEVNAINFGQGSTSYRNPAIAEAMKHLGFAERFGFGIPQAQKALKRNGNPPAEFKIEKNFVLAKIKPHPES